MESLFSEVGRAQGSEGAFLGMLFSCPGGSNIYSGMYKQGWGCLHLCQSPLGQGKMSEV